MQLLEELSVVYSLFEFQLNRPTAYVQKLKHYIACVQL